MQSQGEALVDAPRLALHALHEARGAWFERTGGVVRPAYYGPEGAQDREYTACRERAALVDLSDRALLAVTGPIRQKFLHSILSGDIAGLKAGEGCLAALMDAKGRLTALLRAVVEQDRILLEVPAGRRAEVEEALVHYRVAAPVRFEALADVVVLGLLGPEAADHMKAAGLATAPSEPEAHVTGVLGSSSVRVTRAQDLPAGGFALHVAASDAPRVVGALEAAGTILAGYRALDALRVEGGHPWWGTDIDEDNLLHETGVLEQYRAAAKGCYVGQEVIARLDGRGGHVNRALRGLRLGAPASSGAALTQDGKTVGHLTTTALSPRFGPIALGYVHRSAFAPGTIVELEGVPATVVALPFS